MNKAGPHRKRRANHGRPDTAVVVTHSYQRVGQQYAWQTDVCRDSAAGRHKELDAIIDERTFHRNRFNADHQLALVAPNVSQVRSLIKRIRHVLPNVQLEERLNQIGMVCLKVKTHGLEVMAVLHDSKSNRLFQLEEGFVNR